MLLIFQATVGLMLIVCTSDLMAWKRPTQSASHSVFRPNGALTPMPSHHVDGSISQERYALGTIDQSPASPPVPPATEPRLPFGPNGHVLVPTPVPTYGVHDPLLLKLDAGLTRCSAPTTCPRGIRVR